MHNFYYKNFDTTITSIPGVLPNADIVAYPNPASDVLNISWNNSDHRSVTIELFNALGNKVSVSTRAGNQSTSQLSISHLPAGVYWLRIRDEGGGVVFRGSVVKR